MFSSWVILILLATYLFYWCYQEHQKDKEDALVAALMDQQLAEDWLSPEDSVYDLEHQKDVSDE